MCNTMELGSNSSHTEFFLSNNLIIILALHSHLCANVPLNPHSLTLSNNHIQTTSITKNLDAQFESNLKFKARINDIVYSAHQRSVLIHRSFLSRDTYNLILAFKTFVRPLLKYVSPVWSPNHVMLIRSVEAVQLGFTKRLLRHGPIPYTERLTQLGLQSLKSYGFLNTDNRLCMQW